jgi:hypothetical protein
LQVKFSNTILRLGKAACLYYAENRKLQKGKGRFFIKKNLIIQDLTSGPNVTPDHPQGGGVFSLDPAFNG